MDEHARLRRETRASLCLACGKCTTLCPRAEDGAFTARRVLLREDSAGPRPAAGEVERCLTCGTCELRCPQDVDFTEYVRGLRRLGDHDREIRPPHGGVFLESAHLAPKAGTRPAWLPADARVAEEGEVGLFVGCLPDFEAFFGPTLGIRPLDSARAAIRLLNARGIEPVIAADERCCGHDQTWSGRQEDFTELARANAETFARRGVKELLSVCAECTRTWQVDYPAVVDGPLPKVEHLVSRLARDLEGGPAPLEDASVQEERVTYHDPCRMARHLGVTEEPRRLLDALPRIDAVEMEHHGEEALCCGSPGFIHCDGWSRRLQRRRLDEARSAGAQTLVSTCPKCLIHFACAQEEDRGRGDERTMALKDLTVLTAERLLPGAARQQVPPQHGGDR